MSTKKKKKAIKLSGECSFEEHNGVVIETTGDVISEVISPSECTSRCQQLVVNNTECVALSLRLTYANTAQCSMYLGNAVLDITEVTTFASSRGQVKLRRCFTRKL